MLLQSGGLLLTVFIQFLKQCVRKVHKPADEMLQQNGVFNLLMKRKKTISELLRRPPSAGLEQHPEERNVLALFCKHFVPTSQDNPHHKYGIDWARSLIKRGADVNARDAEGYTPVQSWCNRADAEAAQGILMLLEADADLDAPHERGWTALYGLCKRLRFKVIRELANTRWLAAASVDLPGRNGETSIALLHRKLFKTPGDASAVEMLELLTSQKNLWPAIHAQLGVHEQLIPELAELIVSFIDGGKGGAQQVAPAATTAASN